MGRILEIGSGQRFGLVGDNNLLRTFRIDRFGHKALVWLTNLNGNTPVQAYFYGNLNVGDNNLRLPEIVATEYFVRFYGNLGNQPTTRDQTKSVEVIPVASYKEGDFIGFRVKGKTQIGQINDVRPSTIELQSPQSQDRFNIGVLVPGWIEDRVAHLPSVCGWDITGQQLTPTMRDTITIWPIGSI
jgi:hypothetical protein